jgi:Putative Flp pilus-assembly TadE/G-like
MTFLKTRLRNERGQVMAFVLIILLAILGMAAAVLDVGSWYRADRQLQTTVDAAALAAAQALPSDTASAQALAQQYADKNGGGLDTVSFTTTVVANDTVKVTGSKPAPGFFSQVFGIDSVTVGATATARVGALATARGSSPIAVHVDHPDLQCDPAPCSEDPTVLDLDKVGAGAFHLINLDGVSGGGTQALADWIQYGYDGEMSQDFFSETGNKLNSGPVRQALDAVIGQELLFPVYDVTQGSGTNLEYNVIGWAGFVITGYDVHANKNLIFGHFTEVIWEGTFPTSPGGGSNFGAWAVSLTG